MLNLNSYPIIIVVGPPCTGKTEFLKIAKSLNFACFNWGNLLKEILQIEYEKREKDIYTIIENVIRRGRLNVVDEIIEKIKKDIENRNELKAIVLAGARNPIELGYLLGHFNYHKVVLVQSNLMTRFKRCKLRKRKNDPKTLKEFIKIEMQEYNFGLAEIIFEFINDIIENSDTILLFRKRVEKYLSETILKFKRSDDAKN